MEARRCKKNIAAQKIAQLLADAGKPKNDKVYNTQVYRFTVDGEDWVSMGLAGTSSRRTFPTRFSLTSKTAGTACPPGEVSTAAVLSGRSRPLLCDIKHGPSSSSTASPSGGRSRAAPYLSVEAIVNSRGREIIRVLQDLAKTDRSSSPRPDKPEVINVADRPAWGAQRSTRGLPPPRSSTPPHQDEGPHSWAFD